jgi:glycosyltransferase involved in cell wall biosynthesis
MSPDFGEGRLTISDAVNEDQTAAAQARRDHQRLASAQAEIEALQFRVSELEGSLAYRAQAAVSRRLKSGFRRVGVINRRPRSALDDSERSANLPGPEANSRGRALVIDHHWPTPDRDAGSIEIVTLMRSLDALGFDALLAAAKQHDGAQPMRQALLAQGINCLRLETTQSVESFLAEQGGSFDLVVLCRVYCGGEFLELVQKHCRKARILFNSIDLCFMRVEGQARLLDDAKLFSIAAHIRRREEHLMANCDATIVVSQAEHNMLALTHPETMTVMLPLAREVSVPVTAFADRSNIGFIGGFAHAPNIDAVRYFLAEIWPQIHASIPGCGFDIVGADAPADLLDGVIGQVRLLGHLPDVRPWFESLRLTVAPLRYGAGAKGKVASSLAAGLPCVITKVAAEGMMLGGADGVIIAEGSTAFANAVIRAYSDAEAWLSHSAGALGYANRALSLSGWQAELDRLLVRIGL